MRFITNLEVCTKVYTAPPNVITMYVLVRNWEIQPIQFCVMNRPSVLRWRQLVHVPCDVSAGGPRGGEFVWNAAASWEQHANVHVFQRDCSLHQERAPADSILRAMNLSVFLLMGWCGKDVVKLSVLASFMPHMRKCSPCVKK